MSSRRLQKTGSVEAEVTSCGKLFQSLLPATGKARSPMVTSRVGRTVSKRLTTSKIKLAIKLAVKLKT